eukprot:9209187-Lingulodinium_polyedra.AAC.1
MASRDRHLKSARGGAVRETYIRDMIVERMPGRDKWWGGQETHTPSASNPRPDLLCLCPRGAVAVFCSKRSVCAPFQEDDVLSLRTRIQLQDVVLRRFLQGQQGQEIIVTVAREHPSMSVSSFLFVQALLIEVRKVVQCNRR